MLNNGSIIKLVKAGLSDNLIVSTINASAGSYDTTPEGIIALKTAGASDKVVAAIVVKAVAQPTALAAVPAAAAAQPPVSAPTPAATSSIPTGIDSVGIYYQTKNGIWQEIDSEIVNRKTGGVLKSIATSGLIKGDVDGLLKGASSWLKLTFPVGIILSLPEGRSPGEYDLIRFRVHSNRREFRTVTGGVLHVSSGAARDSVEFKSKKIAPLVYHINFDRSLGEGEYGFLAPTDTGNMGSVASSGKIYTFSIFESLLSKTAFSVN